MSPFLLEGGAGSMNVNARIMVGVTREQMDVLRAICPKGCKYETSFDVWLATSDATYEDVLSALRGWGYRQWDYAQAKEYQRDYELRLIRTYDASDWDQAEYLEPHIEAIDEIYHVGRDDNGRLILGGKDLVMEQDFEVTIFNEWVAPQRTREVLEKAGLEGLTFKPVVVETDRDASIASKTYLHPDRDKPPRGGPWWEIASDIKLPPVSPTMTLTDKKGNPLPPGDESVIYLAKEGSYNHAELHLRRRDIERMEPFDIASTVERFHVNPRLIVSNRFYRICSEHGLKMNWTPVRLDED